MRRHEWRWPSWRRRSWCSPSIAPNFATGANAAEIVRLAVEVGLLALALTPVIVSGGIDLSCGALLGLSAITLGALWRDGGWPLPLAAAAALGRRGCRRRAQRVADRLSRAAGVDGDAGLAVVVSRARRRAHRRGGQLHGPARVVSVARPRLSRWRPAQTPVLLLVALGVAVLLHRTTRGGRITRSAGTPRPRGTPASKFPTGWRNCTCCRDWRPGWPLSSTSPTSGRPRPTRAPATS